MKKESLREKSCLLSHLPTPGQSVCEESAQHFKMKDALIRINYINNINQLTTCNMKGITLNDKPTED